jgi:hypothetical protein
VIVPNSVSSFSRNAAECSGSRVTGVSFLRSLRERPLPGVRDGIRNGVSSDEWSSADNEGRSVTGIRRMKIMLAGNANEREQGIPAGVGHARAPARATFRFTRRCRSCRCSTSLTCGLIVLVPPPALDDDLNVAESVGAALRTFTRDEMHE